MSILTRLVQNRESLPVPRFHQIDKHQCQRIRMQLHIDHRRLGVGVPAKVHVRYVLRIANIGAVHRGGRRQRPEDGGHAIAQKLAQSSRCLVLVAETDLCGDAVQFDQGARRTILGVIVVVICISGVVSCSGRRDVVRPGQIDATVRSDRVVEHLFGMQSIVIEQGACKCASSRMQKRRRRGGR